MRTIEIKTKDGVAPCHLFESQQDGSFPAVIFYMDAFGVWPVALCDMVRKTVHPMASMCCYPIFIIVPAPSNHLIQRRRLVEGRTGTGSMSPHQPSINTKSVMEDTANFLDFLGQQATTAGTKTGCVGYCMGGPFSLSAAGTFPERIAAAASTARRAPCRPISRTAPHLWRRKCAAKFTSALRALNICILPWRKKGGWKRRSNLLA